MTHPYCDPDWDRARAALHALSQAERSSLLDGLSLEEYARSSKRLPKAHRPRFTKKHPLLAAPHAMSLALQLLRDAGQLDGVSALALDSDSADRRRWKYKHQATVTSLAPLAGLTGLGMLVADINQAPDLTPLQGCTGLTHLYLETHRRVQTQTLPTVDLTPLSGLENLELLNLAATIRVGDLAPLASLAKLRILVINDASLIRDLQPLSGLGTLVRIQLKKALRLSDLRPIASILASIGHQNNRRIETALLSHHLKPMVAAWSLELDDEGAEQLCTLRQAIRAGDPEALEAALPGTAPELLDLLLASVSSSDTGLSVDGWADIKHAGGRTTELVLRLARARGTLAGWKALFLAPRARLDHALIDSATSLECLVLASGTRVSGPSLAAWMALPARLRTTLQNLDPEGYAEGLALLDAHDPPAALRTLLLSRMPELVCAQSTVYSLPNMDLRGLELAGKTVTAALPGADLRGMDLTGTHFKGVDLQGAQLQDTTLRQARFTRCLLTDTDLSGATWEDAICDTQTTWPEGSEGPLVLPVSEVIEAQQALEKNARLLTSALRKLGKEVPPHIAALLKEIPTIGLHWSSEGQLQRTLDSHTLTDLEQRLPLVFDYGDQLEIEGQFDDETGHELYQITFGPVCFNSSGEFVFKKDELLEIFNEVDGEEERKRFDRFLLEQLTSDADEWEDTPAENLFSEPETLDNDAMVAALEHVCDAREYPGDEGVGTSEDLDAFFSIIDRIYRRCAPMQKDNESLPMRWIKARLY